MKYSIFIKGYIVLFTLCKIFALLRATLFAINATNYNRLRSGFYLDIGNSPLIIDYSVI